MSHTIHRTPAGVRAGGQFAVDARDEATITLSPGAIYASDYEMFSTPAGQAELALALHEHTGWDIVEPDTENGHLMAVRGPNGRILSMAGADSQSIWARRQSMTSSSTTPTTAVRDVDAGLARSVAIHGVGARARQVAALLAGQHSARLTELEPPIDYIDEDTYTQGLCIDLAEELHESTGWPVVVVSDGPDGSAGWVHAGVQRPDGMIVDINGAHSDQDWVTYWADMVDANGSDHEDYDDEAVWVYPAADHDPATFAPSAGYVDNDVDRARTKQVARMLIAEHGA